MGKGRYSTTSTILPESLLYIINGLVRYINIDLPFPSLLIMAPKIYTSPLPRPPLVHRSVFTHLFGSANGNPGDVGGYPSSTPAYIDAATGTTLTRGQVKHLALSVAYGLKHHPATADLTKRGDTVMVYSPNSLWWPVVVFGLGQ